jgi:hypothetical protein
VAYVKEDNVKRIVLIGLLALVALGVGCQTPTQVGKTLTIQWDAPSLGSIPPAQVSYIVSIAPYPTGASSYVGTTTATEYMITFAAEGAYKIGVVTVRTIPGSPPIILYSAYSWSDAEGAPAPWYAVYYTAPDRVQKVRVK